MTYIVVSENEIVKAEMEMPETHPTLSERFRNAGEWDKYNKHIASLPRIPAPGHKWKLWDEVVEGKDFCWQHQMTTYKKEVWYDCSIEAYNNTMDESRRIVAIPIQPAPEGEKVDERLNVVDYLTKRITELKRIDASFCNVRWDMSKHKIERDLARDMSNETTARRHELEDLLNLLTNDNQK